MKITLAMKDDWQGNQRKPVIDQGYNQDTYYYAHKLHARWHYSSGVANGPDHSPGILMTASDRPFGQTAFN